MSEQGTLNIGSGNDELPGPGTPAFLVVEHNGRKVAIGRNPNYQETIASIKKNVHEFKSTPNDQLNILAFLAEVDDHVHLTEEVWADLLPRLVTIRVESNNVPHNPSASPSNWSVVSDENLTRAGVHVERSTEEVECAQEFAAAKAAANRRVQMEARRKQQDAAVYRYEEEVEKRRQQHRTQAATGTASPSPSKWVPPARRAAPAGGEWQGHATAAPSGFSNRHPAFQADHWS